MSDAEDRPPEPTTDEPRPPRRESWLPARSQDRYLGGVAGGIARALDVDPLLVRLAFVVATFYLPVTLALYWIAWLVFPDAATGRSLLASARGADGWRAFAAVAALGIGALLVVPDLGPSGDHGLTFGVVLLGLGLLLVLRQQGTDKPAATVDADPGPPSPRWTAPSWPLRRHASPPERRPPSYLGRFGLFLLLALVAILAAVDQASEPVKPGVAVSAGLLLVGLVLLVGAWRGRARQMIPLGVVLLPLWIAFSVTDVPRFLPDGTRDYKVTRDESLPAAFEHGFGAMDIDLRQASFEDGERVSVQIGLTAGHVQVDVPNDIHVVIKGDVGWGQVAVLEGVYGAQLDGHGAFASQVSVDVDPREDCVLMEVYPEVPPRPGDSGPAPQEPVERYLTYLTGEPCEPLPPDADPPVLELRLDVGIGTVDIRRGENGHA